MLKFVNAKINIGLNIVGRREDGYHLLNTFFLPVGLRNGTPTNPEPFGDLLELTCSTPQIPPKSDAVSHSDCGLTFLFSGNRTDCPAEKNLVVKGALAFDEAFRSKFDISLTEFTGPLTLSLMKLIPDGAGLGGGSADATFTLRLLNDLVKQRVAAHHEMRISPFDDSALEAIAVRLGADCPVFVKNTPVYAEGIGEIFSTIQSDSLTELTSGRYWLALAKPDLHISTREAFAGITPRQPSLPLSEALRLPISQWRGCITNDFEDSLFPSYPELGQIKESLYASGAIYASMTGSGAALYGIFDSRQKALEALSRLDTPFKTLIMLA